MDFNTYEQLMQFSLTGNMGEQRCFTPHFGNYYATINVLCRTGEQIEDIVGVEELKTYPWISGINYLYLKGDIVANSSYGTLGQRIAVIHISAKDPVTLSKRMEKVEKLYNVFNAKGQSLILGFHNRDDIEYGSVGDESPGGYWRRLLLIGGVDSANDIVELCHRNHVFLGVTDYNKETYLKSIADASYEVDALDVDAVAELYVREGYDGIISNFVDMLLPYMTKISKKVGTFVPYDNEQLRMSTDKKYFKNVCLNNRLTVPREYNADEIKDADFPVIVKPIDGSGSKGISICHDRDELEVGIKQAILSSRNGEVIIEQYLTADEINMTYIAQDGNIQLAAVHDRYFNESQKGYVRVPDMYIYPSKYTDLVLEKYDALIINMLKSIGIKNGSLFIQACVRGGKIYLYEAGMRLNGCKTYDILEVENDFNTFERLICFALTGSMGVYTDFNPRFKRYYATWNVVGRPGAKIGRIAGIKEVESYPWLIHAAIRYQEGGTIPENSGGTLMQLAGRIHCYGDTREELLNRIAIMYDLVKFYDIDGNNALLEPHDVKCLAEEMKMII